MRNLKTTHVLVMIIGLIAIAFGIYAGINGHVFNDYFFKLLLGFSIFGVGYIKFMMDSQSQQTNKPQIFHQI